MPVKSCPVVKTNKMLCKKWMLDIIRTLNLENPQRFNQLNGNLRGISTKTLSERLKELEGHDIISRQVFAQIPPKVEYSLTKKGNDLVRSLQNLEKWAVRWNK